MSNEKMIQEEIVELKKLIEQSHKPNLESSSKVLRWMQSVIAISAVVIGLGVNWGITTTKLKVMEHNMISLEEVYKDHVSKLESSVLELQLSQARDDQLLRNMQDILSEVRDDVKKLMRRK